MATFLASGFGFVVMAIFSLLFITGGFTLGGLGLADNEPKKFVGGAATLALGGLFSMLAFLSLVLNAIAFAKA